MTSTIFYLDANSCGAILGSMIGTAFMWIWVTGIVFGFSSALIKFIYETKKEKI